MPLYGVYVLKSYDCLDTDLLNPVNEEVFGFSSPFD